MAKSYTFHSDSGHGWLAVKRKELIEFGLINKISHYSYEKGETVYLEEDCDYSIFLAAYRNRYTCDPIIKYGKFHERSPIRSYKSFTPKNDSFFNMK